MEKRGIPTATIITTAFNKAADIHRRMLELPQLPYFAVPHPIVSASEATVQAYGDTIFEDVVEALTRSQASTEA